MFSSQFGFITRKCSISISGANVSRRGMGKIDQIVYNISRKKKNSKPKFPVILLEDSDKLGAKFDLVKVERGYARMDLIPNNKATYATPENLERYGINSDKKRISVHPKLIKYLKDIELNLKRSDEQFFEVDTHQLSRGFRNVNLHVPSHCITIKEPITTIGKHVVTVTINQTVDVEVIVNILSLGKFVLPQRYQEIQDEADGVNTTQEIM